MSWLSDSKIGRKSVCETHVELNQKQKPLKNR